MSVDKTVTETRTKLAQIMTPNDANVLGKVFGGSILAMIDLTASATSQKFAGTICVTAAFDRVDFHEPIEVGNLVSMVGTVTFAGRTSMEITIDVSATDLVAGTTRQSNTARVTMVAIKDGKPHPVPKLIYESREEKINAIVARERRSRRNLHLEEIAKIRAHWETVSDQDLIKAIEG